MAEQSLYEKLRQARLSKGITLEEIQEETKIRTRYLEAIEAGEYDRLPGYFYARAFIKHYADYVGLDSEALFQEHQNELPRSNILHEQLPMIKPNARETKLPASWLKNLPSVFMALIVVLILVIIYWFYANVVPPSEAGEKPQNSTGLIMDNQGKPPGSSSPSTQDPSLSTPASPGNEPDPGQTSAALEETEASGIDYAFLVKNSDRVEVTIETVNGDCWFEVREGGGDGNVLFSQTLSQGNTKSWSSDKGIWVKVGAPKAVKMTVNGQSVEIPESGLPRYLFTLSP